MLEALESRWVPASLHVGPKEQYHTIMAAVNAANNGDQVQIDSGTYQEQVTITKSIQLQGQGNNTFILAPTNLGAPTVANPDAIVRVTATSAQIQNITIEGAPGGTPNLFYGVRVDGNGSVQLQNDTITNIIDSTNGTLGVGIGVGNSSASPDGTGPQIGYAAVQNVTVSNYQRAGIVVSNTYSSASIQNNTITASAKFQSPSQTGVEVSDGATADVENNTITGNTNGSNGTGVLLFNPGVTRLPDFDSDPNDFSFAVVKNNKISGNDYGVFGSEVTSSLQDQPESADVENNRISNNTYVGIEFDNSSMTNIVNNQLTNNGSGNTADGGIYLFQSTDNTVMNNQSQNSNGSGIYLDAGSSGNTVQNNQMRNNVYSVVAGNADAVDLSTGTGTSGTANFWSNNQGQHFISNSGKSLFLNLPGAKNVGSKTLKVGPNEPYHTIQAAINAANPGDQIQIDAGTYQEQLFINKSLTIQGQGGRGGSCGNQNATIILAPANLPAPGPGTPDAIVDVTATSVQFQNITIEGAAGGTPNLLYGLRVDGGGSVQLQNVIVTNIIDSSDPSLGVGIDVGNSAGSPDGNPPTTGYAQIQNVTVSNYQRAGIVVTNFGSYAQITNDAITASATYHSDSQTGIEISDGAGADVENNSIAGNTNGSNGVGVLLFSPGVMRLPDYDSDPNDFALAIVKNNKISGNDYGVFGSEVTAPLSDQPFSADVENNQIFGNTYVGIEFDNSSEVSIVSNCISGNGSDNTADGGIYLFQSTNNSISNNVSTNNDGSGIYVDAGSTGNTIRNNVFYGNDNDPVDQNADAVDLSTGGGVAGTANSWSGNQGSSFITNSGQTLFQKFVCFQGGFDDHGHHGHGNHSCYDH